MLTRERLRQIAIVWIVCLAAVSLQPYRPQGESNSSAHRVAHVVAFGVAALMLLALGRDGKHEWMAALTVFCLAVAIETAQHLIYRNPLEWWDVRDDTIGILISAVLIRRTRVRNLLIRASG